ncbi:MAG: TIGR00341 family protein [Paludibacteraceae bacterium]|nr:TIGR00341 family protein [Paludibacteraceae bacterium]
MEEPQESKKQLFWRELKHYIKELIDLNADADPHTTIDNISKGVEFRGVNVWILVFAIVVASIGLNMNSTAVIIGAMLISPLMNPIMGLGLGVGISDNDLIRKSLKNLLIMVVVSLIASTTYFLLTPLSDAQSELLARTKPTIFDVLIALFGGLAGIVASSRKQEKVTVVSGVAIATALMPPLCTAGYGLGTGQFVYFFGAFYLFFINSFFIALATFIMTRYLKFPQKVYLDHAKEKRVRHAILFFSILVIIPSFFIGLSVIRETSFNNQAIKYVSAIEHSAMFDDVQILNVKRSYTSKEQTITLSLIGTPLTEDQIELLQKRLPEFGLEQAKLIIRHAGGGSLDIDTQATMLQHFLERKEEQLANRDSTISQLREQLASFETKAKITPEQLAREVQVLYPHLLSFSVAESEEINLKTQQKQTIPVVNSTWSVTPTALEQQQFSDWMKARLNTNTIRIVNEVSN